MAENEKKGELIPLGGLWLNESQDGRKYMKGYLGEAEVLIFKNKFKEAGDKQPDYRMYVAAGKPRKKSAGADEGEGGDDVPF